MADLSPVVFGGHLRGQAKKFPQFLSCHRRNPRDWKRAAEHVAEVLRGEVAANIVNPAVVEQPDYRLKK